MGENIRNLGYIVAGSMVVIFMLMIFSEAFMNSGGFDKRQESFGCLVSYLNSKAISDEAFSAAVSTNLSSKSCSEVIEEQNQTFYVDLMTRSDCFYPVYNVTSGKCDKMNNRICSISQPATSETNGTNTTCSNLDKKESSGHPQPSNDNQKDCNDLSDCFGCVIGKLAGTDYGDIRFHATAVNVTVIEFQIWKYFTITHRVNELLSQASILEKSSIAECEHEKKCKENITFCAQRETI